MELKVACECGQKYKFDVEPVNGRMPFTVNCPICGVDGTHAANSLLAQQPASAAPVSAAAIVTPVAMAAPISPAAGGLRINRPAPEAAPPPLPAGTAPPPALPRTGPAPIKPPIRGAVRTPKEFNMALGTLGAFLGAAIGGVLLYGFFLWAHFRFPLTGTIIGALSGYGARTLARGTDNVLGAIAGAFALVSVLSLFMLMYGDLFMYAIVSIAFSTVICVGLAFKIAS
jgi:hypothetical protein